MLFKLFFMLKDTFGPFNLFRYVSFRVIAALVTSLFICLFLYPWFIRKLQERQIGQVIREEGPESHYSKAGTPTMGGVLILLSVVVSTLLWADLSNPFVGLILVITVGFGVVGFIDDAMKLRGKNTAGLSGKVRLLIEFGLSGVMMYFLLTHEAFGYSSELYFPFVSTEKFSLTLPILVYIPFMTVAIVGTGNAVNFTDGLDGLAIGPVIIAAGTFLILAYSSATILSYDEVIQGEVVTRSFDVAKYLMIPQIPGVQELAIFCAAIIGAGLGFLWYNMFPAQVFMGDVGSLPLGGALGTMAVLTKHEILSVIIFGLFVTEALSVIIQTVSFKLTGKRVFRMAPIHHHYEKKNWPETRIVIRFWVIAMMLALIALASLKIR